MVLGSEKKSETDTDKHARGQGASVGTDSSIKVLPRAVNCNSDAAGNATTSRTGEVGRSSSKDEFHSGRSGLVCSVRSRRRN